MKNIVLEFDKRRISKNEMLEHLNYYSQKSEEGMKLYLNGKRKEAKKILKDVLSLLRQEIRYYDKANINKYIIKDTLYITYTSSIKEASAKTINTNSYEKLFSNLEEIHFQINYYINMFE